TKYKADERYSFQNDKHTILEVPFDWSNSFYLKETRRYSESDDRLERNQERKVKQHLHFFIESGSLMRNAFITKITSKQIRKNVASLLNTGGGLLFFGIDENRKA